jgi:signal transduction histidine kinase
MILDYAGSNTHNDQKIALLYFDSAYRYAKSLNHDSLIVNALSRKARFFLNISRYDSAKHYASLANKLINDNSKNFSEREIFTELSNYAEIIYKAGLPDTAEVLSKRVLEYARKTNDSGLLFRSNGNLAMYYGTIGRFSEAIDHVKQSLKYTTEQRDSAVGYIRMAISSLNMGLPMKAIQNNRIALSLIQDMNEEMHLKHVIYNNIGRAYEVDGNLDSALYYYIESVKIKQSQGLKDGLAISYINIGNIYYSKSDFLKAREYYLRAFNNPNIENMPRAHAAVTINLGMIYTELGQLDKAADFLKLGTRLATKYRVRQFRLNAFNALAELDSLRGNYLGSMRHKDSVYVIKQRLFDDQLNERLAELEAEEKMEAQVRENELLKKRDAANQNKIFYQRIAIALALLIAIGVIVFLIVVYRGRSRLALMYAKLEVNNEQIRQKNKQLEELNRTKDKFFSIISHDLKGPIGTLIALLQELEEDYDAFDEEERKDIIRNLRSSGQNTYNMLVNLLDWSRSQRGVINNKPQKVDLSETVNQVINVLHERAKNKNIEIKNKIPHGEAESFLDLEMIRTVFINLINNAIKFSYENSEIEIEGERRNNHINIFVKDHGIGIPGDMMESLFQVNTDYQRRGTQNEKGTGLGLILCNEFVKKMNGKITVKSSEQKGSTFKVTLPAYSDTLKPESVF